MDRVAFGFLNESKKKTWRLAMIDSKTPLGYELSLFVPVPGRMGENCVAFYAPNEDELVTAVSSDRLPIPLIVTESMLDGKQVFIVNNHEEVDAVLHAAPEF